MMRLNGNYVPIDPRSWNTSMDVTVNVGLGTGQEEQKQAALNQALQTHMQIWSTYGPTNGLVTMTGMRNTLSDMLVLSGVRNVDRYFNPMTPEQEQQLIQQQQQAQAQQQPATSPEAQAIVQAETIKAQAKSQTDMLKLEIEAQKAIAEDDRKRDELDQKLVTDAAKIYGDYGSKLDIARVKQMQEAPRYPQQQPTQAVTGGRF
jgi:flagellar biosynthesis component FlhA